MADLNIKSFGERPDFPALEERVLGHWKETNAFEQSVEQRPADKPYVFYDGPPFATGMPHYGHLMSSITKDVIPRYWTMKGYRVERVWGWDCHGLPIENMIEKELSIQGGKKGIEAMGIGSFNEACRAEVLRLDTEWEKIITRIGRWVDFDHNYKTMDTPYMESVWWAFKQLYDKDLVYQGRKVILFCPRCSTPLSNFEIAMDNSYKDVVDNSVYIKFKVKSDQSSTSSKVTDEAVYLLAWTTTPWTLMGNVGLAVNADEVYVKVRVENDVLIVAKARMETLGDEAQILEEFLGSELDGMEYEPLYTYLNLGGKKAHYVSTADFVTMTDGTGVVHTAAMYGEDDFELALEKDLPLVDMLTDEGKFMDFVEPIAGQFFKKAEKWIMGDLNERGLLLKSEKYSHSYPHCYRCETPLYYTGVPAWFINVQKIKQDLLAANEHIHWYPRHLKHGRFGKGLEGAPDWNISRSRFWGTPIPIWQADNGMMRVIGSIEDLKTWAVDPNLVVGLDDIHRHFVDDIDVWVDDERTIKGVRIPEVFDCWVESGSMPFASEHYPFENQEKFDARYPAQFITEYVNQTRAWFYTLHVMSVAVFGKHAFEHSLTNGVMLAEDGQKMSKSKKNYPDPMTVVNQFGVDSMRLYIMSSSVMKAENMNFSEKGVDDIRKKVFGIMWNVFSFYKLYDDGAQDFTFPEKIDNVMDRWLVSRVAQISESYVTAMEAYDVVSASRMLMEFVNELSTWWLRQSRDRLRDTKTNAQALHVFRATLYRWAMLIAPFAPFFAEIMYHNLSSSPKDSIHLELFDSLGIDPSRIDGELEQHMLEVQRVVERGHASRKNLGIKTRQPLALVTVSSSLETPETGLLEVLLGELNVKKVSWNKAAELSVELDDRLTDELLQEGKARDVVRDIQKARRKAGTTMDERITVKLPAWPSAFEDYIKQKCLVEQLVQHDGEIEIVRL